MLSFQDGVRGVFIGVVVAAAEIFVELLEPHSEVHWGVAFCEGKWFQAFI